MNCEILKHSKHDFEFYCYCAPGFERVDPYYPNGCIPIEFSYKELKLSSKKNQLQLPSNPFLKQKLGCDQIYETTETGYRCACLRGYRMDEETKKCKKVGTYIQYCKNNQILTLNEYDQPICVCKVGYGGNSCEHNICNWPTSSQSKELDYIHKSIETFCGTSSCRLADNQFKCFCDEKFSKETNEGKCKLMQECSEDQNNGKCNNKDNNKDKMCKILTNHQVKTFECICPIETSDPNSEDCKSIEKLELCKSGYLPNPNYEYEKEYKQKCIKAISSFNFTFQVRFDLDSGNNSQILLGNYIELERHIDLNKIPINLIEDFVNYKDNALIYSMNKILNKQIVKRKMQQIVINGLKRQMKIPHFNQCHIITEIEFDYDKFNFLRLEETLVDINLTINCENDVNGSLFKDFFKYLLKYNYFNSNYEILQDVGYVVPESISYS